MVRLDNSGRILDASGRVLMQIQDCDVHDPTFQTAESVSTQVSLRATVPDRLPAAASLLKPYTTGPWSNATTAFLKHHHEENTACCFNAVNELYRYEISLCS